MEVAIPNTTSMNVHTCVIHTKWVAISALLLLLSWMKTQPSSGRCIMIQCNTLVLLPTQICMLLQAHTSPPAWVATIICQSIPRWSHTEGRQVPPNGTSESTSENRIFTLIQRCCWCLYLTWPRSSHRPCCNGHSLLLLLCGLRSWWHCCVISTHPLEFILQDPIPICTGHKFSKDEQFISTLDYQKADNTCDMLGDSNQGLKKQLNIDLNSPSCKYQRSHNQHLGTWRRTWR